MTPLLAQHDNEEHVSRALAQCAGAAWTGERAILTTHLLGADRRGPSISGANAATVGNADSRSDFFGRTIRSIIYRPVCATNDPGPDVTTVAAVFVNGTAASFCYPCWRTETLWESRSTRSSVPRSCARRHAVRFMIERMRDQGREPVWGALESNTSSLRLARKLGFAPVGFHRLVFARPVGVSHRRVPSTVFRCDMLAAQRFVDSFRTLRSPDRQPGRGCGSIIEFGCRHRASKVAVDRANRIGVQRVVGVEIQLHADAVQRGRSC